MSCTNKTVFEDVSSGRSHIPCGCSANIECCRIFLYCDVPEILLSDLYLVQFSRSAVRLQSKMRGTAQQVRKYQLTCVVRRDLFAEFLL